MSRSRGSTERVAGDPTSTGRAPRLGADQAGIEVLGPTGRRDRAVNGVVRASRYGWSRCRSPRVGSTEIAVGSPVGSAGRTEPEGRRMADIEIGIFKSGRQAYGFDDIAIVPSRRTRDPEDVDISWEIDAYKFELPLHGRRHGRCRFARDRHRARPPGRARRAQPRRASGPATRTRTPLFEEIASSTTRRRRARMQQMYIEPIKHELVTERIRQIKEAGVTAAASVTPQRTIELAPARVRRRARHARHPGHRRLGRARVARPVEPLNLKKFIREFDLPGHRRGLRLVPGRPPSHAHRRGRRAGRRGAGQRLHHPRACSASVCPRPPPSPTWPAPGCAISTRPASTCT